MRLLGWFSIGHVIIFTHYLKILLRSIYRVFVNFMKSRCMQVFLNKLKLQASLEGSVLYRLGLRA